MAKVYATRKQLMQFGSVPLPSTIPCHQCHIPKAQNQYSANRLADIQKHVIACKVAKERFDPKSESLVRCSLCVGGRATEHECYHCEITYPRSDRYFSKRMLKERKDQALCWSCSQREQNDTLSEDDDYSGSGSDDSQVSFVTNRFRDTDLDSTVSGHTSTMEDSSGGVPVNPSTTRSTGNGTTWTGMSNAGSTRGAPTTALTSNGTSTQMSSVASSSGQRTPSRSTVSNGRAQAFNPHGYSSRRSPTSSVAGSTSSKTDFAKVRAVPTRVDMDKARDLEQVKKRVLAKKAAGEHDVVVSSESD